MHMSKDISLFPLDSDPAPRSLLSLEQAHLIAPPHQSSESLFLVWRDGLWHGAFRFYAGTPERALTFLRRHYPDPQSLLSCQAGVFLLKDQEEILPLPATQPDPVPDLDEAIMDWHEDYCIRFLYLHRQCWEYRHD